MRRMRQAAASETTQARFALCYLSRNKPGLDVVAVAELDGDGELGACRERGRQLGNHQIGRSCNEVDGRLFAAVLDNDAAGSFG